MTAPGGGQGSWGSGGSEKYVCPVPIAELQYCHLPLAVYADCLLLSPLCFRLKAEFQIYRATSIKLQPKELGRDREGERK